MRLKDHPKVDWPPAWSGEGESSPSGEEGTLKEIDLIERDELGATRLLLVGEFAGKVHFAEIMCSNVTFGRKLYERIKLLRGQAIKNIGNSDIGS